MLNKNFNLYDERVVLKFKNDGMIYISQIFMGDKMGMTANQIFNQFDKDGYMTADTINEKVANLTSIKVVKSEIKLVKMDVEKVQELLTFCSIPHLKKLVSAGDTPYVIKLFIEHILRKQERMLQEQNAKTR